MDIKCCSPALCGWSHHSIQQHSQSELTQVWFLGVQCHNPCQGPTSTFVFTYCYYAPCVSHEYQLDIGFPLNSFHVSCIVFSLCWPVLELTQQTELNTFIMSPHEEGFIYHVSHGSSYSIVLFIPGLGLLGWDRWIRPTGLGLLGWVAGLGPLDSDCWTGSLD